MKYELPDWSKVKDDLPPMPDKPPEEAYSEGFVGCAYDPEGDERLADEIRQDGLPFEWSDAASEFGLVGAATGGTYLLHMEVKKAGFDINNIARASQACGNCVSRGTQNALLHTFCAAVNAGEGSIPPEAFEADKNRNNPVASEVNYWWKWSGRPGGDGWHASAALEAAKNHGGLVWRRDFSDIGGPDLRKETRSTAHYYGAGTITDKMKEAIHQNPLLSYARIRSFEELCDAIASGHAVQTDGGQGWSKHVNEDGVSRRSGSWSHSMCATGVVKTEAAKSKYRTQGLVLIQNSWANFNGVRDQKVMGTNCPLPQGSFLTPWEDCSNRSWYAVNTIKGWKNRKLRSWDIVRDLI